MITKLQSQRLLGFLWERGMSEGALLDDLDNTPTRFYCAGTCADPGRYEDALFERDGKRVQGQVVVLDAASDWTALQYDRNPDYDRVAAVAVGAADARIIRTDGSLVPIFRLHYTGHFVETFRQIPTVHCASQADLSSDIERLEWLTRLFMERFERKADDLHRLWLSVDKNWSETFHIALLRTMAFGQPVKDSYEKLARTVPYAILVRERTDPKHVEALLFGVSGYLSGEPVDEYMLQLKRLFVELQQKYRNDVINLNEWRSCRLRPQNLPERRLAHIAHLICNGRFTFENVVECHSLDQARAITAFELSEYWSEHTTFGRKSRSGGIGSLTVDRLIINLICPMLFAYGKHMSDESLCERAIDMLSAMPCESNRYVKSCQARGITADNALYGQALTQLGHEYCEPQRCTQCLLGRKILKHALDRDH